MTDDYNIDPNANYKRLSNGHVFSGQQVLNLLKLANPTMQAVILLDIQKTTEPVSYPDSRYGITTGKY